MIAETKTPEAFFPEWKEKLKTLFAKLHDLLTRAEEKLMKLLHRLAKAIRKYWEFLIIPTRILILILRKMKEENCWNCEKS